MHVGDRLRYLSAIVLVLLCGNAAVTATAKDTPNDTALNMNNICLLLSNGARIANPNSCSSYYLCLNGVATPQNCSAGDYFAKDIQICVPQYQVNCMANTNGTDAVSVNLCSLIKNGIYFGSAVNCSAWNFCNKNVLISGNCQNNLAFNTMIGWCDYPPLVTCSQVTNDPKLTPGYGGPCKFANTTSAATLTKAASDCNQYYQCNGDYYQLTQCNGDLFYDTVSQTCVSRLNARNNCNRCAGSQLFFANMYSTTSCKGFVYCRNGVEQGTGYCSDGTFFNEVYGACLPGDEPDFGCCNPAYYGNNATSSSPDTPVQHI